MRKPTQAQQRERALINFNDRYIKDLEQARKIINSYYRLCGLSYRVCILENDATRYNSNYTKQQSEKEQRHIEKLNSYLQPYGLKLIYAGIYPTIGKTDNETNAINETAYFYIG